MDDELACHDNPLEFGLIKIKLAGPPLLTERPALVLYLNHPPCRCP